MVGQHAQVNPSEEVGLRAFLADYGADIAGLLAGTDNAGQLALARAYRAVVTGQPGAHEEWGRLVARISG